MRGLALLCTADKPAVWCCMDASNDEESEISEEQQQHICLEMLLVQSLIVCMTCSAHDLRRLLCQSKADYNNVLILVWWSVHDVMLAKLQCPTLSPSWCQQGPLRADVQAHS